jgi:hypothetical protein
LLTGSADQGSVVVGALPARGRGSHDAGHVLLLLVVLISTR